MKDRLEALIDEMLESGIGLDEALGEFEKRFLQTALARTGISARPRNWFTFTATPWREKSLNTSSRGGRPERSQFISSRFCDSSIGAVSRSSKAAQKI